MINTLKIKIDNKTIDKVNYLLKDIDLTINDAIKMFLEKIAEKSEFPFKIRKEFNTNMNSLFNNEKINFESIEEFLDYCND